MHAVKCAGQDEQIVRRQFRQTGVEFPIVDEAAGFVDDEKGKHDPVDMLVPVDMRQYYS